MKAVSAMLTKCRSSLALYAVEFQVKRGRKTGAFGISIGEDYRSNFDDPPALILDTDHFY